MAFKRFYQGFLFDRADYELVRGIDAAQAVADGRGRLPVFAPELHPRGIRELAEPQSLRLVRTMMNLLDTFEAGSEAMERRLAALQALRDLTLDGSIRLMHTLSTDQTLEQLLEQAKGEKNLQRIRMYLRLLEEYSTYMTKVNKRKTLVLLYELLMHPDGDVRRIAGRIMGKILENAGPRYRKERPLSAKDGQMPPAVMALLSESAELWTHYIGLCLHPDYPISRKHAPRISNSLKTICQSLFASCEEKEAGPLVKPLLNALTEARDEDRFVLVDALCHVPCRYLPKKGRP